MADLGEVGGRVAHVKDGGDRVGGLGLDVEGQAGGDCHRFELASGHSS